MKPGVQFRLDTSTNDDIRARLLRVDALGLSFLNPEPVTDAAARAELITLARQSPDEVLRLQDVGHVITRPAIRLSADGVFVNGTRVAALDRVILHVDRENVERIATPVPGLGAGTGFLLGVAVGIGVGLVIGSNTEGVCHGCGGIALLGGLVGSALGYLGGSPERNVVYQKPRTDPASSSAGDSRKPPFN
jgi:hypothetical protein